MYAWVGRLIGACLLLAVLVAGPAQGDETLWYQRDTQGDAQVQLYFFWSKQCPHCLEARPYIETLAHAYPWLRVRDLELTEYPEHVRRYLDMAATLGEEARSVPAFLFCGQMRVGFDSAQQLGETLRQDLLRCHAHLAANPSLHGFLPHGQTAGPAIEVPWLGVLRSDQVSLPLLTIILAGLDAFNPCAFFVLLFLLSLLVHAQSRVRILVIGNTFVFFSGLLYFLFMAAWLNVFLVIGQIGLITTLAGILAVLAAAINIKDYFWFKQGVSLTIPDSAKPGLFERMRRLVGSQRFGPMLLGSAALALFANAYELLCTAGFPMVFTRILTLNELSATSHYLYLVLYNVIYIIPLAIIVLLFTFTLGARKLKEREGRVLKLLSGIMMAALGLVLLIAPAWLNHPAVAVVLLGIALAVTAVIVGVTRKRRAAQ